MKRELDQILDDYISKSDYRDLIIETEGLVNNSPKIIIQLLEKLTHKDVEHEWKRSQLKDRFTSYLLQLEEETQIDITYEVIRKFSNQLHVKEIADKLCFFVSQSKLFNKILRTKEEEALKEFNRLLINELLLRGKVFSEEEKKIVLKSLSDFDLNWVELELDEIEKDLPLRSYSLNGGSCGISFGLQSEEKFPYSFSDFEGINLVRNKNEKINNLASMISREYIHLIEVGDFEYFKEDVFDLEAGIICHLNYQESLSESVKIAFKHIDSKDVFKYLFNMSVFGGAYERGEFGATSRINTWKVISGLLQKDYFVSDKKEILAKLNEYRWTEFSCDNGWFINEWLDLGIIGINENENKYAVLVISDTD
ncbi:DUF6183 family protein [Mariniphaga sediminis]|uniref:DUF6183 family protein n=1 Tax=Mariniphaga sediminis TaxID=1628158 RepID=UPI00356332CE